MEVGSVIEVEDLRKAYGDVQAVNGVSFNVRAGEIFGMVGPNGAGKTTTTEIVEGLRPPDSGRVTVLGMDVVRHAERIKERIGVQLQSTSLYPNLTVREIVDLFGGFFRRSVPIDPLIELLDLTEKRKAQTRHLSGGQRQRLSVALALVNDPDIVFLDEPTTGLDPQARRSLWDVILGLREKGKTVFLTTHYMEEAERLCDRVAVVDHGHVLAADAPGELVRRYFRETAVQFEVRNPLPKEVFCSLEGATDCSIDETTVTIYSRRPDATLSALMALASSNGEGNDNGLQVSDVHIRRASLEDVFLKLTGRRIRE